MPSALAIGILVLPGIGVQGDLADRAIGSAAGELHARRQHTP
ncbi:hypothetical protein [Xanthomonas theicola]|nr:hypothetical protein [Xanthomonas theicola]